MIPTVSTLAEELGERLQRLDPQTAAHVERAIREVLALTESVAQEPSAKLVNRQGTELAALASLAEPMGRPANADIDRAIYGE
jgi:hypothetical protein